MTAVGDNPSSGGSWGFFLGVILLITVIVFLGYFGRSVFVFLNPIETTTATTGPTGQSAPLY